MSFLRRFVLPIVVGALIVVAIVILERRSGGPPRLGGDTPEATIEIPIGGPRAAIVASKMKTYERAKEVTTPDAFIYTEPFTIAENIGKKVILVDFWTYSCINCQRTFPHLNMWQKKYADEGLLIIGVHTPEFEFEKEYDNVLRATEKFSITYPVVLDNDYSTWRAYGNRYWPRKYLIDIDGFVVYDHIGEGKYKETEEKIVELLNERKEALGDEKLAFAYEEPTEVENVDFLKIGTKETYLGSARTSYLVNPSNSCQTDMCSYRLPEIIPKNRYALEGKWNTGPEAIVLADGAGKIAIRFNASKVNLVAGSDTPIRARILLDGKPITPNDAGGDVKDAEVVFTAHNLYNIVNLHDKYEEHLLEIEFLAPGVNAFAFTFG